MSKIPFNLERALAGDPVVTRYGLPATIAAHNPEAEENFVLIGWVSKTALSWSAKGEYVAGEESSSDLFMATQKRQGWINIIPMPGKWEVMETVHESETAALLAVKLTSYMEVKTIRIEWEE